MKMITYHKMRRGVEIGQYLIVVVLSSLLLAACPRPEPPTLSPLLAFADKVAQLVTTSVRSFVRNDPARQEVLTNQLSSISSTKYEEATEQALPK